MIDFNFKESMTALNHWAAKNSPAILTGIGISGVVTTALLAGRATLLADRVLEQRELKDAPKVEQAKVVWKYYAPPVAMGTISIAAILMAHKINTRRNAGLSGLLLLSEKKLLDYEAAVAEEFGEKGEKRVRDVVDRRAVLESPIVDDEVIHTKHGGTLVFDSLSGRYFYSSTHAIKEAVNTFNSELLSEGWLSLNSFYSMLNLGAIDLGEDAGWEINQTGLMGVRFSSQLTAEQVPCLVINYQPAPQDNRW